MTETPLYPPMFWLALFQIVLTILVGLYVWLSNRNKATAEEIKSTNAALSEVDSRHVLSNSRTSERLAKLEGAIQHLPTAEQFSDLRTAVARTEGTIDAVDNRITGVERMLSNISNTMGQLVENELAEGRQQKSKGRR